MTKSTQNRLVIVFFVAVCAAMAMAQDESDPILEYYWNKAARAHERTNPKTAGVSYTLTTRTFFHQVNSRGEIAKTDTVLADVNFNQGRREDSRIVAGDSSRIADVDLSHPDIFVEGYRLNFFPNDTGGSELSIGMTADSSSEGLPDGLIVIDRRSGHLRRMYLHYPDKAGYKRFSRSFRFVEKDGFLFPDSVWEVGVELGFLSSKTYRIETGISEIRVHSVPNR